MHAVVRDAITGVQQVRPRARLVRRAAGQFPQPVPAASGLALQEDFPVLAGDDGVFLDEDGFAARAFHRQHARVVGAGTAPADDRTGLAVRTARQANALAEFHHGGVESAATGCRNHGRRQVKKHFRSSPGIHRLAEIHQPGEHAEHVGIQHRHRMVEGEGRDRAGGVADRCLAGFPTPPP